MLCDVMELAGKIDLRLMLAQTPHIGDERHNRNNAGTALLIQTLTPWIIQTGYPVEQRCEMFGFIPSSDYFSGPVWMAMYKATVGIAYGIECGTVATAMARSGVEFGPRINGLPG